MSQGGSQQSWQVLSAWANCAGTKLCQFWPLVTKLSCPAAAASLAGFLWLLQTQGPAAPLI